MKTLKTYEPPGYVQAFTLGGMLCAVLGLISIALAVMNEGSVWAGVGLLLAAFANFIYAAIADAIARIHWRVDRLAEELLPVINEARIASDEREKRERATRLAQEEEIRRVVERGRKLEETGDEA